MIIIAEKKLKLEEALTIFNGTKSPKKFFSNSPKHANGDVEDHEESYGLKNQKLVGRVYDKQRKFRKSFFLKDQDKDPSSDESSYGEEDFTVYTNKNELKNKPQQLKGEATAATSSRRKKQAGLNVRLFLL